MEPFDVVDLCRRVAYDGVGIPLDAHIPHLFNDVHYQQLWASNPRGVRAAIDDLLCGPRVDEGLEMLLRTGVMSSLFPEVAAMQRLGDADGLHKDVWDHTKAVVMGVPPELDVRWGALVHDIGKVATRRFMHGRVTFHGHDAVGARLVDTLDDRTSLFDGRTGLKRTVRALVLNHLRPAQYQEDWADSGVRRLVHDLGGPEGFKRLMLLSRADLTTKNPRRRNFARAKADQLEARVKTVLAHDNLPKLPKGTMGAIMQAVAAKPGSWLNEVRRELEDAMAAGLLAVDLPIEEYIKEGLKIVQEREEHG